MDLFPEHKSKLIKDTTRKEREEIVRRALRCSEGCENCTGCALGAGDAFEMYRPLYRGKARDPRNQHAVPRALQRALKGEGR